MTTNAVPGSQGAKTSPYGCFWIVVLIACIGWLTEQNGCSPAQKTAITHITKAEWKEKLHSRFPNFGVAQAITAEQLDSTMGPPSSTQTIGRDAYWYYDCADGMIQAIMLDPVVYGKISWVREINDY